MAGSALKAGQIDAHANFVPFGELFPFRGFARKIYDGSSTGVTTTHGVQVRSDYAEKYPEIVVAYLKATLEADRLYRAGAGRASRRSSPPGPASTPRSTTPSTARRASRPATTP